MCEGLQILMFVLLLHALGLKNAWNDEHARQGLQIFDLRSQFL